MEKEGNITDNIGMIPGPDGTLIEDPAVVAIGREFIEQHGLQEFNGLVLTYPISADMIVTGSTAWAIGVCAPLRDETKIDRLKGFLAIEKRQQAVKKHKT